MVEKVSRTLGSFRELEHKGWNRLAVSYGDFAGEFTPQAAEPLLDVARVIAGMRVLDVACGPGYVAAAAAARGASAIGIDFAGAMVVEARHNFPTVPFEEGDAEALSFADASFDAVICAFGLLHMADPDRAIGEAHRVLRPGGSYAFTVWSPPDKTAFFRLVMDAVRAHGDMTVAMPEAPPMFRFADPEECRRTLMKAGFAAPEVSEIGLIWHPRSTSSVLDYIYKSSVRMPLLLNPQSDAARAKIHQDILENAKHFEENDRLAIAWSAVLVSARKPRSEGSRGLCA